MCILVSVVHTEHVQHIVYLFDTYQGSLTRPVIRWTRFIRHRQEFLV